MKFGENALGLAPGQSLPTRGAWIEMAHTASVSPARAVAPHPGSVDGHTAAARIPEPVRSSLPTRGAWIEIKGSMAAVSGRLQVAPHTGSVD